MLYGTTQTVVYFMIRFEMAYVEDAIAIMYGLFVGLFICHLNGCVDSYIIHKKQYKALIWSYQSGKCGIRGFELNWVLQWCCGLVTTSCLVLWIFVELKNTFRPTLPGSQFNSRRRRETHFLKYVCTIVRRIGCYILEKIYVFLSEEKTILLHFMSQEITVSLNTRANCFLWKASISGQWLYRL